MRPLMRALYRPFACVCAGYVAIQTKIRSCRSIKPFVGVVSSLYGPVPWFWLHLHPLDLLTDVWFTLGRNCLAVQKKRWRPEAYSGLHPEEPGPSGHDHRRGSTAIVN